jgi:TetR/AcrR family transcriptional repressor of nem operon
MGNGESREADWPTARGRFTRARIVDTAADLFARHGIVGTSVEDVRRAAAVSGSQITHYFHGKPGLIRAVIDRQADATVESLEQSLPRRFHSLADLYAWAAEATVPRGPTYRLGVLAGELVHPDPQIQAALALGFGRWATAVREALTELRRRGVLSEEADPHALAYALLAGLQGGSLVGRTARDATPSDGAVNAVLTHIASLCTGGPPFPDGLTPA